YLCPNGECVPSGRDFYCNCDPGFTPSFDRRRCLNELPPIMPYINDEAVSPSKFPYVPTTRYTGGDQPYQWNSWRSHRAPNYQPLPRRSWSRPNGVSNAPCNQPHIVQRCSGGMCLNLGGRSYMCECLPGFDSYDRGRYCGTK
ncbi:EGF-like domain protein, partial [Opisthorchis viverrini]